MLPALAACSNADGGSWVNTTHMPRRWTEEALTVTNMTLEQVVGFNQMNMVDTRNKHLKRLHDYARSVHWPVC
jgi:hypothetical protein